MAPWFKLDNAAKLFPSVTSEHNSSVFRLAAVLTEPVDKDRLQQAADKAAPRYPMLFVRMRQGVFWNYFDENREAFLVEEESKPPCAVIYPNQNNGYFLRLLYHGHRISVEVFHALTDGAGAVEYLKTVLYYYFRLQGRSLDSEGRVLLADGYVPPDNMEDSFAAYYQKPVTPAEPEPVAYHITGTPLDGAGIHVTTGVLDAAAFNTFAKSRQATVTSCLTAAMIYAIYMTRQGSGGPMAPIVVSVPVNLRRAFPSATLRNFFGIVNVGLRVTRQTKPEDILAEITAQLKVKTGPDALQDILSRNVQLEKSVWARLVPLGVKKPFVNAGFLLRGEKKKTITLSNLGRFPLPSGMTPLVQHMEVLLYPTATSPVGVGVCSVGDRLSISFSRSIQERDLARYYFRFLRERSGLDIAVYANDWGEGL